jgi:pyrroline-5-carboxylate reductase
MMAEAIARGLIGSGVKADRIIAFDPAQERLDVFSEKLGAKRAKDNAEVVETADLVVLAVKPFVLPDILSEIGGAFKTEQLIISIAAGVTTESIESKLRSGVPVVRVMPNTPCLIGEGISAIAPGRDAGSTHLDVVSEMFGAVGKVVCVSEDKLDAVTGLSGSGPAYAYTFIEALADGGVSMGLPRATAILLAAQTVVGAALMVIKTGEHPAVLRDRVTTPGGTTIAGSAALEDAGFRSAVMNAVAAATQRSAELGKPKT